MSAGNTRRIRAFAWAFAATLALAAAMAWLGGYNFDRRGLDVFVYAAYGLLVAAAVGVATAVCPWLDN